ncbi:hypothetical protein PIB30_094312 [Stylosanthes scabra]|uniref:Uncharacterized protein n=1 Tax=Stylosanthes scabra TaxID=79078 RepID=A0ABU6UXW9_9FABA|nr:hypothetical protein [Stylosanthes scabra]
MVPFCEMVAVECFSVVTSVLFKAATEKGLSYYVFIAYSYVISTFILLLPLPFIFTRTTVEPRSFFSGSPRESFFSGRRIDTSFFSVAASARSRLFATITARLPVPPTKSPRRDFFQT